MTHALNVPLAGISTERAAGLASAVTAAYEPGSHPHVPAGSSSGGQFAPTGGNGGKGKAPAKTAPKGHPTPRRPARGHSHGHANDSGDFRFDGHTGPGYGMPGGSPKVKSLQDQLVAHGFASKDDKALQDGKYGPKTTAAVKRAQRKLGLKPDGIATPAFIAKLAAAKHLKAAADAPYGDVAYADPGYQADGKQRYPIDTEEHCRAAWSYINMPDNADKYSAGQLATIKSRIKAAGKRYGVTFAAARATASASLKDVELARPGTWQLASGEQTFTAQMLQDAARYAQRDGARPSPVKLGHNDPRFSGDGEPAMGWLGNIRYLEDERGPVVIGDIDGMPDWLAAAAPDAWPNRSVEGWTDYTVDGETYGLVIDGLALLGVTPPGISSIRSLRDLPQALGVAASARIVARAPNAPAPEAVAQPPKGTGMDPAMIREALGLPADASDDEVKAAVVTAGLAPPNPEPVEASEAPEAVKHTATSGTVVLASSVWDETQKTIKNLTAHVEKQKRDERDEVIAKAVVAGKFTPAQKPHFSRLWDADPDGTRVLIDTLTPNSALAVLASGYADGDGEADAEYAALYRKVG
jgi:peptidoglycan hydrolase-like protein with peptidoglycan-binding domain